MRVARQKNARDVRLYSNVLETWTGCSFRILKNILVTFALVCHINIEVEYLEDRDVIERPIRARPVVRALHKVCIIARMSV